MFNLFKLMIVSHGFVTCGSPFCSLQGEEGRMSLLFRSWDESVGYYLYQGRSLGEVGGGYSYHVVGKERVSLVETIGF